MAGFALSYDWDDSQVQQLVKTMIGRTQDMTPVMADFSEYLLGESVEYFEREEGPDGTGWQVLADATKADRAKRGKAGKKLQVEGILKDSLQREHDTHSAGLASTNVEYAAIQNLGGWAGKGRKVKIPSRRFMGFKPEDITYFKGSLTGWIITGKAGG